jgi:N-acylglucosamine-6-phosphate 2-epimerase
MVANLMFNYLKPGLIVSCQAPLGSPLRKPGMMSEFAKAAEAGGAIAIRAEGVQDITEIAKVVSIPVIGLIKKSVADSPIYITPEIIDVKAIHEAGAQIVAFDATMRKRPAGMNLEEFVHQARETVGDKLLMADVDNEKSALAVANYGVDLISTTLSGYTDGITPHKPDLALISNLKKKLKIPIIAEGRFTTPAQVHEAIKMGAWAVCVGKAITDPWSLTKDFVEAMA